MRKKEMKFNFNSALMFLDIFPGQKRTLTVLFAMGMVICQAFGFHVFMPSDWAGVGIGYPGGALAPGEPCASPSTCGVGGPSRVQSIPGRITGAPAPCLMPHV